MNQIETSRAMYATLSTSSYLYLPLYRALNDAVSTAVYDAVDEAVFYAVDDAVRRAVDRSLRDAVYWPLCVVLYQAEFKRCREELR